VSRRGAVIVGALALAVLLLHAVLVRAMAHGHVAHVLLGSGNAAPPIGAAVLAASLVAARFLALVVAPGVLLASFASLLAHGLVGPKGRGDEALGEAQDPSLRD
jgi:hypothetical protein